MEPIKRYVDEITERNRARLEALQQAHQDGLARLGLVDRPTTNSMTWTDYLAEQKKIPESHWRGFDAYCPALQAAQQKAIEFVTQNNPAALVLSGPPGTGKSHLAGVIRAQLSADLVAEPDLVAKIQSGYSGEGETEDKILIKYKMAHALILDDVGTAHVRPESLSWIEGIYWRLLDRRAQMGLKTVITTNLSLRQLRHRLGERATSRLMGMMGTREDGYVDLFDVSDYRVRGWR